MRFHTRIPALFALVTALGCSGATPAFDDGIDSGPRRDSGNGGGDTSSTDDTGGGGGTDTGGSKVDSGGGGGDTAVDAPKTTGAIKTVFLLMMENHSWADIKGSSSTKYINDFLLPVASHAEQYFTPPGNHPSEPNYIWLEAGDNLAITDDNGPDKNHRNTTAHLVTQLEGVGVTWKAYVEDIDGTSCPLADNGLYAAKHVPMLFFDDVTNGNDAASKHCIDHVRPFGELATDLSAGKVARFNFITPNLCDDMHGQAFGTTCNTIFSDLPQKGDDFLKATVPGILDSAAYKDGGALFILWDEGSGTFGASDGPIGLIVLSPLAKGGGYASSVKYDHSSTLRTMQTIFGVPFLRGAEKATDLADLFKTFP